jgi:hypothetical protein
VNRRSALKGILLSCTAPFFVPAERLMRIKPLVVPTPVAEVQGFHLIMRWVATDEHGAVVYSGEESLPNKTFDWSKVKFPAQPGGKPVALKTTFIGNQQIEWRQHETIT